MGMEMLSAKEKGNDPKLEILASKIMNRLRLVRDASVRDNVNNEFIRASKEIFEEDGVPEEDYRNLRKQIGAILNQRKPRLVITKKERGDMIKGSEELIKKNKERGINENGDPLEEYFK